MASRFARNFKHGIKRSGAGRPKKGLGPFKVASLGQDTYEKLIEKRHVFSTDSIDSVVWYLLEHYDKCTLALPMRHLTVCDIKQTCVYRCITNTNSRVESDIDQSPAYDHDLTFRVPGESDVASMEEDGNDSPRPAEHTLGISLGLFDFEQNHCLMSIIV